MTASKLIHRVSYPDNNSNEHPESQYSNEGHEAVFSAFSNEPHPLPYCTYPHAGAVAQHGLQPLPKHLPMVDFARAKYYRSQRHTPIPANCLSPGCILQMAQVIGESFAKREPMTRHLQPPKSPPTGLRESIHRDPFGQALFGSWTKANLMTWFIRLFILTEPASPRSAIRLHEAALTSSLAILDGRGRVIGGAFNEPMPLLDTPPAMRQGDPILNAVNAFVDPFFELLWPQDVEASSALSDRYPAFRQAHQEGKVGHHFMVARSDALPKEETFELVAASAEHFQALGFAYMLVEASNQWTGAACEVLGGVRVHFAPYQVRQIVPQSPVPLDGIVTSPDGFISGKDSGCMFYVIRLS